MLCKNKVTQAARALHENPGQYASTVAANHAIQEINLNENTEAALLVLTGYGFNSIN